MTYTIKKQFNTTFEDTENNVLNALKQEGFGVLTEIDVQKTLKQKLNIAYKKYKILGVCNPTLAYKALTEEQEIGAFLPCNILIFENKGKITVSIMKPTSALSLSTNSKVKVIAKQAEKKLANVLKILVTIERNSL